MKSRTIVASAFIWVLALPSIASAQAVTNRPPSGPPIRSTQQQDNWRLESEQARLNAMTPEEVEAEYGAERLALANRVQALIDEGKCREARAMANEAGERQMAIRVRQTCRSR